MNAPLDRLRHHVSGAIERGEAEPIAEVPAIPIIAREPGAPNLDCACTDELREFAAWIRKIGARAAFRAMFPEREIKPLAVIGTLSTYAEMKARAMEERARGNISGATWRERLCDELYDKLPGWARW